MGKVVEAVGSLFGGGGSSAPAAPDYAGAAQATAQGNLDAARATTAANRINQVTPYGNLNYTQSGTDSYGNPTWTATTSLSDVGQKLLNQQNEAALGLGGTINAQLGQVQETMGKGFNPNIPKVQYGVEQANFAEGPQFSNIGKAQDLQTGLDYGGMAGWDKATDLMMQRLNPQMEQQSKALDAKLAAQGVQPGSTAYNRAQMQLAQQQNDLRNQAQLGGQQVQQNLFGQALQGGQFKNTALTQQNANQLANLGFNNQAAQQGYANQFNRQQQMYANRMSGANFANQAQQQGYNQALTKYNLPLNTLSALRTGAQVQNPTFVNTPQQATTAGPDLLGAAQMTGNYNLGNYNAQQAAQSGLLGGLLNAGGMLGGSYLMSGR
jgi:hypothetical protein